MFDFSSLRNILPAEIYGSVSENLNTEKLREIRIRAGKPVTVLYDGGVSRYLTKRGISETTAGAIVSSAEDVKRVVVFSAEHSVYAYNEDINRGFITLPNGGRVGICGEVVTDGSKVISIKDYSSVNIRIPHEIFGCAQCIMPAIVENHCRIMIVSAPGAGKTTLLRDIARQLSDKPPYPSVLIADERNEISCTVGGINRYDVGAHTDVIVGGSKEYVFECAIRSMRPDVIVTDEIFGMRDVEIIREAVGCGISVIASAHAADPSSFSKRSFFSGLIADRLFERYFFLSDEFKGERIKYVRDGDFAELC